METFLTPIIRVISENEHNSQVVSDVVGNFISSFEISRQTLYELEKDSEFPHLIESFQHLLENNIIKQDTPKFIFSIIQFLTHISIEKSSIRDAVCKKINFDINIPSFFGFPSEISVKASQILLRFIASMSSSQFITFSKTKSIDLLFTTLCSSLQNKEYRYWSLICLSNLPRSSQTFLSFVKSNHFYNQLKIDLGNLLLSEDKAVIGASLSASISIYPLNKEHQSAIKAAMRVIESPPNAKMFIPCIVDAILDIERKFEIDERTYLTLFNSMLKSSGPDATALACGMNRLPIKYANVLSEDDISQLLSYIIETSYPSTSLECTSYLYQIADEYPALVASIPKPWDYFLGALDKILKLKASEEPEEFQALLYLMRLMVNGRGCKSKVQPYLERSTEDIFMIFMRHVNAKNSSLSIAFFQFLFECSVFMKGWSLRMRRVLLDSNFTDLLADIVRHSQNRRDISGAVYAMQLLMCDLGNEEGSTKMVFFEHIVSSLLEINSRIKKNTNEAEKKLLEEQNKFHSEKRQLEVELEVKDNKILKLETSIASLKSKIAKQNEETVERVALVDQLKTGMNERKATIGQLKTSLEVAEKDLKQLSTDNEKLTKVCAKQKVKLEQLARLKANNIQLQTKLDIAEHAVKTLKANSSLLESQTKKFQQYAEEQAAMSMEKDKERAALQAALNDIRQQLRGANESIATQRLNGDSLKEELEKFKMLYEEERDRSATFERSVRQLEFDTSFLKQTNAKLERTIESQNKQIKTMKESLSIIRKENVDLNQYTMFDGAVGDAHGNALRLAYGSK